MERLLRSSNAAQNAAVVERLAAAPGASLLEIGFGPGDALEQLAQTGPALLAGADHSALMVTRATRRLRRRLAGGCLDLRVADASALPFAPASFDVVFAVNSFHQWSDPAAALGQVRHVLRPGGRILLSIRVFKRPGGFEAPAAGREAAIRAERALGESGFGAVERTEIDLGDRWAAMVEGRAPA